MTSHESVLYTQVQQETHSRQPRLIPIFSIPIKLWLLHVTARWRDTRDDNQGFTQLSIINFERNYQAMLAKD